MASHVSQTHLKPTFNEYFERHQAGNDPHATYKVGKAYMMGNGVEKNLTSAQHYLFEAARNQVGRAYFRLGELTSQTQPQNPHIERHYSRGCSLNDSKSQRAMGQILLKTPKSLEGENFLKSALEQNDKWAGYYLGCHYLVKKPPQELEHLSEYFTKAITLGCPAGHRQLAGMYRRGSYGLPQNTTKAIEHYRKAIHYNNHLQAWIALKELSESFTENDRNLFNHALADNGDVEVAKKLAEKYEANEDYLNAEKYYHKVASSEQGDADTQYKLGCLYEKGLIPGNNKVKAEYWLWKAAEKGLVEAQYVYGTSELQFDMQRRKWCLRQAYIQDYKDADYHLANLNTSLPAPERLTLFQKGAFKGDERAAYLTGLIYYEAKIDNYTEKSLCPLINKPLGVDYLEQAAQGGLTEAMSRLARIYLNDAGLTNVRKGIEYSLKSMRDDPTALDYWKAGSTALLRGERRLAASYFDKADKMHTRGQCQGVFASDAPAEFAEMLFYGEYSEFKFDFVRVLEIINDREKRYNCDRLQKLIRILNGPLAEELKIFEKCDLKRKEQGLRNLAKLHAAKEYHYSTPGHFGKLINFYNETKAVALYDAAAKVRKEIADRAQSQASSSYVIEIG